MTVFAIVAATTAILAVTSPQSAWWDNEVQKSIDRAPEQKAAWQDFLNAAPKDQREGYAYLIKYLPEGDLRAIPPTQLANNIDLAYKAFNQVAWKKLVPDKIFLDSVLPHANVTEPRHEWRKMFMDKYLPLVKNISTPGEAALLLNATIFKDYKVGYNTRRLRTDQSPDETIAQGMATCTGLSIMLVDACRAVGIPARIAGIHSWPGRGGNHTWTEIWDNGTWHYVGAAEPDPNGLNHAWFGGEAANGIKDKPENAIYAVTYAPTGEHFPLAWDPGTSINAENVTDRYKQTNPPAGPRLMVEVKSAGTRVEAEVTAVSAESGRTVIQGLSFGPSVDINRHIDSPANPGQEFLIAVRYQGKSSIQWVTMGKSDTVVDVNLDKPATLDPAKTKSLLADRFSADESKARRAENLLAVLPYDREAGLAAWEAYKASPTHEPLKQDFEAKTVKTTDRTAPYLWRTVGEKGPQGWALVIAMHGGGGTTQEFNDQQWRGMFERYYKDHPEAGGYIYLALRAPNNEWNGFYDDPIGPFIETLIKQFVLFADVDPNRVYATGASHGGYGAFVIGPKIPFRFAAVNASASAPTPGETEGRNLRNLKFTWVIGEQDTAYERTIRCQAFDKDWKALKAQYGGFEGGMEWLPGVGHSVPDRDKTLEFMQGPRRVTHPDRVVWKMTDDRIKRFYWIENSAPAEGATVDAQRNGNEFTVATEHVNELIIHIRPEMVDLDRPVTIAVNGGSAKPYMLTASLGTYCTELVETADPQLACPIRVPITVKSAEQTQSP